MDDAITIAAKMIKRAAYMAAFCGAGISTASGIPDFRSPESGLWEKYSPGEVASLNAFRRSPEIFYDWIRPLFMRVKNADPNPAHVSLTGMQEKGYLQEIITQNIDGLQQKAGANKVIELHGSAKTATCPNCFTQYSTDEIMALYLKDQTIPTCMHCKTTVKPDVILFDELLPEKAWQEAQTAIQKADLILIVGSSLTVFPANTLPLEAHHKGAQVIINTLTATENEDIADLVIRERCEDVLPQILSLLEN